MASMKTLGRQSSKKLGRLPAVALLACLGALLSSCLLQPKPAPGATQASGPNKKKTLPAERWQTVGGDLKTLPLVAAIFRGDVTGNNLVWLD